jgi:hypothetical protein
VVARQDTSAARVHLETLTSCSLSKAEVPVFRQQHLASADSHVIASPQMLGLPNLSDVWRVLKEADLNKLRREAECPFQVLSAGPLGSLLQSAVPRLESSAGRMRTHRRTGTKTTRICGVFKVPGTSRRPSHAIVPSRRTLCP